jgi:hypothetical protein
MSNTVSNVGYLHRNGASSARPSNTVSSAWSHWDTNHPPTGLCICFQGGTRTDFGNDLGNLIVLEQRHARASALRVEAQKNQHLVAAYMIVRIAPIGFPHPIKTVYAEAVRCLRKADRSRVVGRRNRKGTSYCRDKRLNVPGRPAGLGGRALLFNPAARGRLCSGVRNDCKHQKTGRHAGTNPSETRHTLTHGLPLKCSKVR